MGDRVFDTVTLSYGGDGRLMAAAQQIGIIIDALNKKYKVTADLMPGNPDPVEVRISSAGALEITKPDSDLHSAASKFLSGIILGAGMGKAKRTEVDRKGIGGMSMSPVCFAIKFASFADMAETLNTIARNVGVDPIDVSLLPPART